MAAELGKSTGEEVPCPICRKEFRIPEGGFDGLQKNFFMEKLVEMRGNFNPPINRNVCESCQDEDNSVDKDKLPMAEVYCVDCQQRLCSECRRFHLKSKLSKNHRVMTLDEQQNVSESILVRPLPEMCQRHCTKSLDIYCSDCMDAVCSSCFFENHKSHDGSSVDSMADKLQKQIQEYVNSLKDYVTLFQEQKRKLEAGQIEFTKDCHNIELEISKNGEELKAFIDGHSNLLLAELRTQEQVGIKNKKGYCDDLDSLLISLESFETYCKQLVALGSASSVCKATGNLSDRSVELKKLCDLRVKNAFEFPQIEMKIKQQKQNMFRAIVRNLVGKIEADVFGCEPRPIKSTTKDLESDFKVELEDLRKLEKTISLTVRIEQLESIREELSTKVKKLEQEIAQLRGSTPVETREVMDYSAGLMKHHGLIVPRTKTFEFEYLSFAGLAALGNELFVAGVCGIIEVWNLETICFKRMLMVNDVKNPKDMTACVVLDCLYLLDESPCTTILAIDLGGNVITSWPVIMNDADKAVTFSITDECNVLLITTNRLIEYSKNGQILHTIHNSSEYWNLQHGLKLSENQYLISDLERVFIVDRSGNLLRSYDGHEYRWTDDLNPYLSSPVYMKKDKVGNILVADYNNGRLLVLNSNLEVIAIPLTSYDYRVFEKKDNYRYCFKPQRLCLCEASRKIIVAERVYRQNVDDNRSYMFDCQIISEYKFSS